MLLATSRRLRDELNITAPLEFVYKFAYQAQFDNAGAENELCHVFLGKIENNVQPNEHEVAAIRYVSPDDLLAELAEESARMEWLTLVGEYRDVLARYCPI
jgi:isopentenyl-diphosphate delta-isomerase